MTTEKQYPGRERRLRFLNNVVYELLPSWYNALDWLTFGAWWKLVQQALIYVPEGGRVLEIGFGPGRLHLELARRADHCAGLDLAWGMCRYTQRRLRRAGLQSHLVRGNAYALPYASNTFDTVVSTFALSGMTQGTQAVKEMARVTAQNGRVVLVDIGLPSSGNWLGKALAHLWELFGDTLYDQAGLMNAADLKVIAFQELGPGSHIRAVVGQK